MVCLLVLTNASLFKNEVKVHQIASKDLLPSRENTNKILKFSRPQRKYEFRSFLGMPFKTIKKSLEQLDLLVFPDCSQPFVVPADTPGEGIGYVLLQQQNVILFPAKFFWWETRKLENVMMSQIVNSWLFIML